MLSAAANLRGEWRKVRNVFLFHCDLGPRPEQDESDKISCHNKHALGAAFTLSIISHWLCPL